CLWLLEDSNEDAMGFWLDGKGKARLTSLTDLKHNLYPGANFDYKANTHAIFFWFIDEDGPAGKWSRVEYKRLGSHRIHLDRASMYFHKGVYRRVDVRPPDRS
ncbi:MAG TPA: hypothetical protein VEX38_09290, partial [Fimbriimonadaceae bacterium]|nr:hypothetical protein [Fimbriimonadaceae bacterium]